MFQALRSPAGDATVLEQNMFVEQAVPGSILRQLSEEEMTEYRRPFREAGEGRRPTLSWPRQIPIDGEPADVNAIVSAYADWLSTSPIPKLFIVHQGEPGAILSQGKALEFCRSWPEQKEISVAGIHYLQEDSPDPIRPGYRRLAALTWVTQARRLRDTIQDNVTAKSVADISQQAAPAC
jgi:haloalkane dehalogenase